jgi:hypothetical protein
MFWPIFIIIYNFVIMNKASKETTYLRRVPSRVARWFLFKPKIPIWVNFGGP